jgi:hypothetical protein
MSGIKVLLKTTNSAKENCFNIIFQIFLKLHYTGNASSNYRYRTLNQNFKELRKMGLILNLRIFF